MRVVRAGRPGRWAIGAASLGVLAAVVGVAFEQARDAIETQGKGLDLGPVRSAVLALTHGTSIYVNHRFVYPPTAAVALLPVSLGRYRTTVDVWLVLCVVGVAAAGFLAVAPWRRGRWIVLSTLAAGLLVGSDALRDTLWIGNVSLLLAPLAVGVLLLYEDGRWRAGTALLVLSLLIKPILIPLLLIPMLRRRWRAVAESVFCGAVLLALAILLVPGGGHFFAILRFEEGGGSLTGRGLVYNIAISGLAHRLGVGGWGSAARVALVAALVAATWAWARRPSQPGSTAAIGSLLLLGLFLAGSLSEDNYLLVAAPCVLTALALGGTRSSAAAAVPALVLVAFPRSVVGDLASSPPSLQVRYLLAEVFLAFAAAAVLVPLRGARRGRGVFVGTSRSG
jgi:arabinofuranan 3-O-arabinosyltransferase